jgi:hypothetical protein
MADRAPRQPKIVVFPVESAREQRAFGWIGHGFRSVFADAGDRSLPSEGCAPVMGWRRRVDDGKELVMTIVGPRGQGVFPAQVADDEPSGAWVDALVACARQCMARADSCLAQDRYQDLAECIAAALRCADICQATAWAVTRDTGNTALTRAMLDACAMACRETSDQCTGHANRHQHRRACAQACRRAEQACDELRVIIAMARSRSL